MQYIIHLTDACNLKCKYCYENKSVREISFDNITKIIDNEIKQKSKYASIYFYGGEPLLKKQIIKDTIKYIESKKCKTKFKYGITTNGTLLDDDMINLIKKNEFTVAYSIDGGKLVQNLNRITADGKETFDIVEKNAKKMLNAVKTTIAMAVITKNNLKYLTESVKYLYNIGFRYINLLFDYTQNWKDEDLIIIKDQYSKLINFYEEKIMNEEDINIPLIDEKVNTYIKDNYNCNKDCQLGIRHVNVGTDGNFYPCVQFVGNDKYIIGNYEKGIDFEARAKLIKESKQENDICKNCAINKRCKHTCACKNYMITKDINEVSPLVCETERLTIELVDKMAERLYKNKSKLFLQKYYNKSYNIINQYINDRG